MVCGSDVVVVYGHADTLAELDERRRDAAGEHAHERAVAEHGRRKGQEEARERERDEERTERTERAEQRAAAN